MRMQILSVAAAVTLATIVAAMPAPSPMPGSGMENEFATRNINNQAYLQARGPDGRGDPGRGYRHRGSFATDVQRQQPDVSGRGLADERSERALDEGLYQREQHDELFGRGLDVKVSFHHAHKQQN
ncbi:hypothetical protein FISHEDRAFT_69748 [Fistulina hepatica ATCC 64428]|uniref:Uncharacterized protein n=1 Tax=Fistulina hepatica ATCC 64428 TaxID=1128425 RepID=A0A0D7AP53_9AGAR|nr:hypothetical protein FISHEDRAFT_69748 [Fistulina hepatica ATCC 64428]